MLCLYPVAVAFLCFAKPEDVPQLPTSWFGLPADKVGHFIMFFPYPFLAYMVINGDNISIVRKLSILVVILCLGAGLAMGTEKIQALLEYREASTDDFIADLAGMASGALIIVLFLTRNKK